MISWFSGMALPRNNCFTRGEVSSVVLSSAIVLLKSVSGMPFRASYALAHSNEPKQQKTSHLANYDIISQWITQLFMIQLKVLLTCMLEG